MDRNEIRDICEERLGRWTERLVAEHSTPVLLLGVGHDHKSGQLVLLTIEDIDDKELLLFAQYVVAELKNRVVGV